MNLSKRKRLAAFVGAAMLLACASAGADTSARRYSGLAVGISALNQYPVGGWSDYAKTKIGGGLAAEYTLPHFLPLDIGASARLEFAHTIPKSDTTLKSSNEIRAAGGVFARIPFALGSVTLAFQPEVAAGASINNTEGQNGSKAGGWYTDTLIMVSPSVRLALPSETLSRLEFEVSPVWTLGLEDSNTVNNIGFRLGGVWHFE